MEQKRFILAMGACALILVLWYSIFPPTPPVPPQAPAPAAGTAAPPGGPGTSPPGDTGALAPGSALPGALPAGPGTGGAAAGAGAAAGTPAGAPAPPARPPEEIVVLESPVVRFELSSWTGALRRARLREAKYLERAGDPGSGLELIRSGDPAGDAFRTSFPDSKGLPADPVWQVERPDDRTVVLRTRTDAATVEKRYRLDGNRYRLQLDVVVGAVGSAPLPHHLALSLGARQDPEHKGGGIFTAATANLASIVCHVGDKSHRHVLEELAKGPFTIDGAVNWLAADDKFFARMVIPFPIEGLGDRRCTAKATGPEAGEGMLVFPERSATPDRAAHYAFTLWVGPKLQADLDHLRPGGADTHAADVVDVSIAFLSRPLLGTLKAFHRVTGNWGVAIILLTFLIRLVTFYPTHRQMLSGKRMQKLAPELAKIRKKFENDKARQGQETMNLYKTHGVNPLGGCLPALIQMPIWIALYSTLNYAVELYRSPFILHIQDLTAKDPFYVTPLLMGAVMYLQMRMSPAGPDPAQQKMMAVMMPVMFTAFSLVLPAGLAVYMLTSYSIAIGQQLLVNHLDKKATAAASARPGKPGKARAGA